MPPTSALAGSALLASLGREVGALAAQADQLQDVLSGIGASGAVTDQALVGVQALDALAQHAAELGAVLCALSGVAPADWRVQSNQVLQGAGLASLAHRLSGVESEQAEASQPGEFELLLMIRSKADQEPAAKPRINLEKASILLVENGAAGIDILVQILTGFGAKKLHKAQTVEDAQVLCGTVEFDLVLCETQPSGPADGFEFVRWLRRHGQEPNRFAPVIMMSGHTPSGAVARTRDSGANFIVAKPLTPAVLLDRIFWLGRASRPFVETEVYCGPDRRFKFEGPPNGIGRRCDDLSTDVGQAKAPNMSQDEIDALMQPRRVSL